MGKKPGFFKRNLTLIIAFLLLCDAGFSFYQYYHQAFDGDTSLIVLPGDMYKKVMTDPFGFTVMQDGDGYAATNRYFAHATMMIYFRSMPIFLQNFMSPIDSLYFSSALMKTFIHFFLVYLIGVYISGKSGPADRNLLIAMLLVTPLFHNWGSKMYLGFVDYAVNYAVFYALPLGMVMLFFLPFWLRAVHGQQIIFRPWMLIALALLAVVIAFNGPLAPVILAMICAGIFFTGWWRKYREVPGTGLYGMITSLGKLSPEKSTLLLFIILMCGYSYYLGTYNTEHNWWPMSLAERYALLPQGLWELLSENTGVPLLLLGVMMNTVLLFRHKTDRRARSRFLVILLVITIGGLAYLCLLPMGGYREYRPYIIRQDTAMPFLLGLVIWYGMSTFFLLHAFAGKKFTFYLLGVITFLLIFISNDPAHYGHYKCEREALEMLAASEERVVKLPAGCPVLGWGIMLDTNATEKNVHMLRYWNVIDGSKTYYQSWDISH